MVEGKEFGGAGGDGWMGWDGMGWWECRERIDGDVGYGKVRAVSKIGVVVVSDERVMNHHR